MAGRHGKGAALYAAEHYGAQRGYFRGPTGDAYALPTKDSKLNPLPLSHITIDYRYFYDYAVKNPNLLFLLTPFGTGLAGHSKSDIWYIIVKVGITKNTVLTSSWVTG